MARARGHRFITNQGRTRTRKYIDISKVPLPLFAVSRATRSGVNKNRPQEQLGKLSVDIKKEEDELEEQINFDRQDRASTPMKEESQELENMSMFDLMERLARR
ncbi:hypothetical protein C8R48DRAFT_780093 [Suillus tomentosus]|nr:hypothetical protein C8R48DRAFT_780093 [Suillus tomentosus]